MSGIKIDRISRKFDRTIALDDISLEIPDGEFWVFVGPSGCGKSTLLRIIAGLESASGGDIYIGDRLMNNIPARQRDVAMVFQNYALYPHMSVADNLAFGLKMRGANRSQIIERIDIVSRSLEIAHLLERYPRQLSGGQQQRVALGRAIARSPQLFLLDEPLSNLDAALRDRTRTELKQLHQQFGITTIYVTHDRTEAMTLADKIVILDGGRIQQIDSPQVIYNRPANQMVATFIGTPPMNIIPATYRDRIWQIGSQSLPSSIAFPVDREYHLGIRPEDLTVVDRSSPTTLDTIVKAIEPLGREILINGQISTTNIELNTIVPPTWTGKVGDICAIDCNLNRLYLFDSSNGKSIDLDWQEQSTP
jgi:multiple sugar transport system ATP-binding protein